MSDVSASDLRTRIASAISGVDDWRGVTDPAILADAVIAALRLKYEGYQCSTCSANLDCPRWITE